MILDENFPDFSLSKIERLASLISEKLQLDEASLDVLKQCLVDFETENHKCDGCDQFIYGPHGCPGKNDDWRTTSYELVITGFENKAKAYLAIRKIYACSLQEAGDILNNLSWKDKMLFSEEQCRAASSVLKEYGVLHEIIQY